MEAPCGTVSDLESSNSSSDAEELERCREAAMPAWGLERRPHVAVKPRAVETGFHHVDQDDLDLLTS
ncbi:C12orf43 isoform 4 [Pongo abelii]|uniref:C12orf43 isoform 4 n=1 Tax=Pongo abelii TaxID=9601 RepID=A0A2J8XK89_PONAB|nr:C12orf43 isoform 4 [Pongo abelii]